MTDENREGRDQACGFTGGIGKPCTKPAGHDGWCDDPTSVETAKAVAAYRDGPVDVARVRAAEREAIVALVQQTRDFHIEGARRALELARTCTARDAARGWLNAEAESRAVAAAFDAFVFKIRSSGAP